MSPLNLLPRLLVFLPLTYLTISCMLLHSDPSRQAWSSAGKWSMFFSRKEWMLYSTALGVCTMVNLSLPDLGNRARGLQECLD